MSFLKQFLPAPVVDILLPVVLILALLVIPRVIAKINESGLWDRIVDRVGGDKFALIKFERQIARLRKAGDLMGAARLYEDAEWYPEAINLYVEAEEYSSAGALYEAQEQWERAADMYMRSDDWKRAAGMYRKAGKPAQAANLYDKHGQKIDAAKMYFDAGQYDRAAELYEDVSYFPQAAKCYEKLGEDLKAAENYEQYWTATTAVGGGGLISSPSERESKIAVKAGQLFEKAGADERAAAIYKRAGLASEAAKLAARMGNYAEAAEMLLKEEKLEEAAEMFEQAGNVGRAALLRGEIAFHHGDNSAAAEHFLKGGDNLRAAELYEAVGNLAAAAKCYEQSDAPLQAANVYLRADKKLEAANMFERAQDFETAARLFEEVGDPAKASALYEQSGRHFEAGKLAQARGDADRSIQLLQQVDANHEKYSEAMLILSRLFVQKDMPALAVDKLQRLLGTQQIGSQTLEHYYCLGLAYEQLGKTTEALDTFRKVMTERYGYQDVEQRIQRLTSGAPAPAQSAPVPAEAAPPVAAASAAPGPTPAPPPQAAPAPEPQAAPVPPPAPAPTAQPASSPIQLGTELGKGLLGVTYQAVDTRNQRPVVVKLLRQDLLQDRDTVQRFLQEAKIARAMEHPSLVRMLGIIEVNGHKAAVTEYVEGFDLASFVSRSKHISVKQAVDLLATLSSALGYAHERKLLHRDLKMTNVLVGKGGRLRVAGFGLGALRVPQLGRADGYPPPEFLSGQVNDLRSDIYSLGALIFHAVSGFHPENEQLVANGSTPRLRQIVPDAPEVLEQILMRCLASEPASRFANSTELLAAVRTVQA